MQFVVAAQDQPVAVSVSLSWHTFVAITMAVVLGLAIYDLARIAYDWADETVRQVWPMVRWWWQTRSTSHDADEPVDGWVPNPPFESTDREQVWGWWVTQAGTLHLAECRVLSMMTQAHRRPFVWANNIDEARYWSAEQELEPCGVCRPLLGSHEVEHGDQG